MLSNTPPFGVAIFIYILFCTLFFYLPFIYLFYQSRNLYPINARLPYIILCLTISIYGIACNEFLNAIIPNSYPCAIREIIGYVPYVNGFMFYNYRLLHLLFAHKITKTVIKHKNEISGAFEVITPQDNGHTLEDNWYVKHRYLVNINYGQWYFIVQNIILFIIAFISVVLDPKSMAGGICDFEEPIPKIFQFYALISNTVCLLMTLTLGLLIRSLPGDAFWIKKEFRLVVYTAGISLFIFGVLTGLNFPRFLTSIFVLISNHFVLFCGIIWPYVLSRREQKIHPKKNDGNCSEENQIADSKQNLHALKLIEILTNPKGFEAFLDYLRTEFSTENLLFWDAVEQLKRYYPKTIQKTNEHIVRIYTQYIQENAPCQINISYEIKAQLNHTFVILFKKFGISTFTPSTRLRGITLLPSSLPQEKKILKKQGSSLHKRIYSLTGRIRGNSNNNSNSNSNLSTSSLQKTEIVVELGTLVSGRPASPATRTRINTLTVPQVEEEIRPPSRGEDEGTETTTTTTATTTTATTTTTLQEPPPQRQCPTPTPIPGEAIPEESTNGLDESGRPERGLSELRGGLITTSLGDISGHPTSPTSPTTPINADELGENEIDLIHIFDRAQQHIYDLMNNDSFPRFQRSKFYQKLLQHSNELRSSSSTEYQMMISPINESPRTETIEEEEIDNYVI